MVTKDIDTECLKCGYKWRARVENPLNCPRCKRYDWNKDRKKKNGDRKKNAKQQQ